KNVNFGIPYGAGPNALARQARCSLDEAISMLNDHRLAYPRIWEWIDERKAYVPKVGYSDSIWGRRRFLPKVFSEHPEEVAAAEREGVNMIIQGSAADITKRAMVRLHETFKDCDDIRMILQVHDELVFELDDERKVQEYV